jgi:hypothetical protein
MEVKIMAKLVVKSWQHGNFELFLESATAQSIEDFMLLMDEEQTYRFNCSYSYRIFK